jgi:hypothetical protein
MGAQILAGYALIAFLENYFVSLVCLNHGWLMPVMLQTIVVQAPRCSLATILLSSNSSDLQPLRQAQDTQDCACSKTTTEKK